jgi:hypothetical protein
MLNHTKYRQYSLFTRVPCVRSGLLIQSRGGTLRNRYCWTPTHLEFYIIPKFAAHHLPLSVAAHDERSLHQTVLGMKYHECENTQWSSCSRQPPDSKGIPVWVIFRSYAHEPACFRVQTHRDELGCLFLRGAKERMLSVITIWWNLERLDSE